jgi:hypothetical protein
MTAATRLNLVFRPIATQTPGLGDRNLAYVLARMIVGPLTGRQNLSGCGSLGAAGLDSGPLHLEHAKPDRHCMRLFKHPLRLFLNCSLLPQVGTDRFLGSTKEVAGK